LQNWQTFFLGLRITALAIVVLLSKSPAVPEPVEGLTPEWVLAGFD